jgi:small subunit ribosomal protein S15
MKEMKKPAWLKLKEQEVTKIIEDLSKKYSSSQIGIILRDQYGIPTIKLYGKKLKKYLKQKGIECDEELKNAEKKVEKLKEHLKKNITDRKAKHKLQKAQSRLNVLKKYYKKG